MSLKIDVGSYLADKYWISATLGSGANGTVYLAQDPELDRKVAIKVLHSISSDDVSVARLRFERETRALSQLMHENIVRVYRFGILDDDRPFLVMEFAEGDTLRSLIEKQANLSCSKAIEIALQICSGLEYAHLQQIVHRDLKPENVIIQQTSSGVLAKIVDFGLCKQDGPSVEKTLTETGFAIGTAFYMSPEQCLSKEIDGRTDIYSFGCVLFEMITGKPPFTAESAAAVLLRQISDPMPKILDMSPDSGIPQSLQDLICKCTAKSKDDRYQSFAEIRADLLEIEKLNSEARFNPSDAKGGFLASHRKLLYTLRKLVKPTLTILALLSAVSIALLITTSRGNALAATRIQASMTADKATPALAKLVTESLKMGRKASADSIVEQTTSSTTFFDWKPVERDNLLVAYMNAFEQAGLTENSFAMSMRLMTSLLQSVTKAEATKTAPDALETQLLESTSRSLLSTPHSQRKRWSTILMTVNAMPTKHKRPNYMLWPDILRIEAMNLQQKSFSSDRYHNLAMECLYTSELALENNKPELMQQYAKETLQIARKFGFLEIEHRQHAILARYYLQERDLNNAKIEINAAISAAKDLLLTSGDTNFLINLQDSYTAGHYLDYNEFGTRHKTEKHVENVFLRFVK